MFVYRLLAFKKHKPRHFKTVKLPLSVEWSLNRWNKSYFPAVICPFAYDYLSSKAISTENKTSSLQTQKQSLDSRANAKQCNKLELKRIFHTGLKAHVSQQLKHFWRLFKL
jgi:hypothetical protein